MWDSFLIFLGLHPFLASLLPVSLGCVLLLFVRRRVLRMFGCVSLLLGILVGATLHLRWDSFSIHFSKPYKDSLSEKISVLFVGDSITCEGSRPRGFITKIKSILPIDHQVVCLKGATSIEVVGLLEKASLALDPAFIIAQSGINDLLKGIPKEQIFNLQATLFKELAIKFPGSKVLFLPIHPLKLQDGSVYEFPPLTPANFPVWWEDPPSFVEDSLLSDGIHFSAQGHSLLAKVLINKIFSGNS